MSRFAPPVRSRRSIFAALAVASALTTAALLAAPTTASAAQPDMQVPQTTVYYSYRDLATEQGTRALYERIAKAAKTVCPGYDSWDLTSISISKECQRQAVARAVQKVGDAHLAAVHARAIARRG